MYVNENEVNNQRRKNVYVSQILNLMKIKEKLYFSSTLNEVNLT